MPKGLGGGIYFNLGRGFSVLFFCYLFNFPLDNHLNFLVNDRNFIGPNHAGFIC